MHVTSRRFGPDVGLPLVALPGLNDGLAPLSSAAPAPPPAAFARDPVVVLSYPDPLPAPEVTTRELAGVLAGFLEEEVGPCVLSGHSMGAMVGLHLAADRPDLVRGLVLSAALACADAAVASVLGRWERSLQSGRFLEFHRDAVAVAYTEPERARRLALLEAAPPSAPPPDLVARHVALSGAARRHDATDRLRSVTAPTLVLAGEHDPLTRPHRSRELASALPRARFELIPHVAHGFPEQAADRYTAALDAFIHRELTVTEPT